MAWYNFFMAKKRRSRFGATLLTKTRETRDTDDLLGTGLTTIVAPTDDADWKLRSFTEEKLATMSFGEILSILVDASPDLDRALSDMQMQVNTRHSITIAEDGAEAEQAERIIQNALDRMRFINKEPLGIKIEKFVSSAYLKGAISAEVVFDNGEFIDMAVWDPHRVRFEQREDNVRGQYWQIGQEINGVFSELTTDNFFYLPFNSLDDKPYGRSMVGSAIFPMVFLLGLIKDGRQIIKTQAYPRQVALVDRQKFIEAAGEDNEEIYDELDSLVTQLQSRIQKDFKESRPTSQFVYGNEVSFETVGEMARKNLDAMEMIKDILQEWIIQGLKQYPATFGVQKGNALSTNADQQLELFTTFIDSFQERIEELLTSCFTRILSDAGNSATPIVQLERDNSLVDKQRAERSKLKTDILAQWLADRVITQEEYRLIIRTPEAFDDLSRVLEPDLPPELLVDETEELANDNEENSDE